MRNASLRRGIVCYDGACSICRKLISLFGVRLRKAGFRIAQLQDPDIQRRLGLMAVPDEMKLILPHGPVQGGIDAVITLSEALGMGRDLAATARSSLLRPALDQLYRLVAKHRRCSGGTCRL